MKFLFVGERRSNLAVRRNYTWKDGRLAAKQLFDALAFCGIDPKEHKFANIFEPEGRMMVDLYRFKNGITIVAMGNKVQKELKRLGVSFIPLVHPAARGKIRKKELYFNHVFNQLIGK